MSPSAPVRPVPPQRGDAPAKITAPPPTALAGLRAEPADKLVYPLTMGP